MQDADIIPVVVAGFAAFWVVMVKVNSHLSGWASLAGRYRCLEPFSDSYWNFRQVQFGGGFPYTNCITVGSDQRGLFLRVGLLYRVGHSPLLIPWREVSVASRFRILWFKRVRLLLGHDLQIPITIGEELAQKLQSAAGLSWPVESGS